MEKTSRLQCQRTNRWKEKLGANTTNTSTATHLSCVASSWSRSQPTLSERWEHHGQLPGRTSRQTLASSLTANLKSPMNLTSMHDCGRTLEHLEQTHTELERTCAQKPSVVHNYTARQTDSQLKNSSTHFSPRTLQSPEYPTIHHCLQCDTRPAVAGTTTNRHEDVFRSSHNAFSLSR